MPMFDLKSFAQRYLIPDAVPLPVIEQFRAALAGFLGLAGTFWLAGWLVPDGPAKLLCGPLAASTVLLFVLPHSPVAQPWPFVGGSLLSSLIGLTAGATIESSILAVIVAVPVSIILMNGLRCLHPPGAAAAAVFATTYSSWTHFGLGASLEFLLLHLVLLLGAALCLNNSLLRHPYPHCKTLPSKTLHRTDDPAPLARLGLHTGDIHKAMAEAGTFMDILESDLEYIYRRATRYAFQRHANLTCADIMTRDIVTLQPDTVLEAAWVLLRRHKIKALPVLDAERRVIGVITVADFLKHFDDKELSTLGHRLRALLKRPSARLRTVSAIMSTAVITVPVNMAVVELVSRLSDEGLHHLPIVDEHQRLCGMVTQSDLIAALYHQLVLKSNPQTSA